MASFDPYFYIITPASVIIALAFAGYLYYRRLINLDAGTDRMKEVQGYIAVSAQKFVRTQYLRIILVGVVITALIFVFLDGQDLLNDGDIPWTSISFALGVLSSLFAAWIALLLLVKMNARTTAAAGRSKKEALGVAFDSGVVMGLVVVAMSLAGIIILYTVTALSAGEPNPTAIVGYAFGASFAALFAQLGGGIFTKAADMGADLAGKVEAGIPEDDPRNPAVITDNVGDGVGDMSGRSADLFESITGENIGAMIVGLIFYDLMSPQNEALGLRFIIFPLVARAAGLLITLVATRFVKLRENDVDPMKPMKRGLWITTVLSLLVFAVLIYFMLDQNYFFILAAGVGLILAVIVTLATEYYTSTRYKPVKETAASAETGAATNILSGLSFGMDSATPTVIGIIVSVVLSYYLGYQYGVNTGEAEYGIPPFLWGVYATTIATMSMLSITGMILAMDGYGPIADNAAGIAEMANAGPDVRESLDALDSVGNATKALAKGYGMASAGLAALLLFQAYLDEVKRAQGTSLVEEIGVNLSDPGVLMALLFGALVPFLFSGLTLKSVGRAAGKMVDEVRRQFREIPGLLEGEEGVVPDYERCTEIATKASLREMILPSLIVTGSPIVVGFVFGAVAVAAFLIGATFSGVLLAIVLNNGGAIWDNAKKYIEEGNFGGKGSKAHAAAVEGDTLGDPTKDTTGPSLHVLVKLINTVALACVVLFVDYGGWIDFGG